MPPEWGCMTGPLVKRPPARNEAYLAFVREVGRLHGCCACRTISPFVEAHHEGRHGTGQKPSDYLAVPLCIACHRELHGAGGNDQINGAMVAAQARILREWIETGRAG